jgi:preprotein translocase subunit SecE
MSADNPAEEKSRRRRKRRSAANEDAEEAAEEYALSTGKGRATPGRRALAESAHEGNIVTRRFRGLREYLKGVGEELDKVVWPSREDTIRLSRIVLSVTILASIVLGAVSLTYTEFFRLGFQNEIIFVIGFAAVAAAYFAYSRLLRRRDNLPPY